MSCVLTSAMSFHLALANAATACSSLFEMVLQMLYCSATLCCPRCTSLLASYMSCVSLFSSTPTWALFSLLMPFLWCRHFNTSLILLPFPKNTPCSLHTFLMLGGGFLGASPALHIMSSDSSADKVGDLEWDTDGLGLLLASSEVWYCLVVPLFFSSALIHMLSLVLNS